MARFVSSFNQLTIELALLPVPTVAALNGFAVAGGWILALACDWRVMTTGNRRVGINEVDLGVPMPAPAAALARNVGGGAGARDMFVLGRLYAPDEALAAGLVDRLAEPDRVREQARALAELAATKPRASAVAMKRILREPFARAVTPEAVRANERQFLEAWWRPDVRPLLDAAAARLVPR
jgi:enoyl-CoA hydratase